jgi:hypothetical protein
MEKVIKNLIFLIVCIPFIITSCQEENDFSNHVEFTKPMLFRPDSSYYTCTKYVPELEHSVRIKGNAYITIQEESFGLACSNFTDTLNWINNEFWAGLNEHMGASYCKLQLGRISLGGNNLDCVEGSCSFSKWNQDIPLAAYTEDPDKASWLEITMIDSLNNMVEGKFQFHFVLDYEHDASAASFARKISYVSGEFRAKANF